MLERIPASPIDHQRGVSSMPKSTSAPVAGLLLSIFGASFASAASLPLLSGSYVYTNNTFCQMPVTAKYGSSPNVANTQFVAQIFTGPGPNTESLSAGTFKFVQSATGSGSVTANSMTVAGSPILLTSIDVGKGGVDGSPLTTQTNTGAAKFTQTATTITINEGSGGTSIYHIYYGKVAGGIVQNATAVGVDSKGCAEQYTLTHS
jgi:hypothetical protein